MKTLALVLVVAVLGCGVSKVLEHDEACEDDMATPTANVSVLISGLNQKAPGTIAAPGTLRRAENTRIDKGQNGGLAFKRRNGLVEKADAVNSTGFRMGSYAGGLMMQELTNVERYSLASKKFEVLAAPGTAAASPLAPGAEPIAVSRTAIRVPYVRASGTQTPTQSNLDLAYFVNTACHAWVDQSGAAQYLVIDKDTGTTLQYGAAVGAGATKTKVVQLGGIFYLFWKEANAIKALTIGGSTPYTVSGVTTVYAAGVLLAGTDYDVTVGFDTTHIAILYRKAAGTYTRALLSTAFAVGTTVDDATAANQPDVALCWLTNRTPSGATMVYGTLNAANGSKSQTIDTITLAISSTDSTPAAPVTNVRNMTGFTQAGVTVLLIEQENTLARGPQRQTSFAAGGVTGFISVSTGLASRAFWLSGVAHWLSVYNSTQASGTVAAPQDTYFLSSYSPQRTVAKILPGLAGKVTTFGLSSGALDAAGVAHVAVQNAVQVESASGVLAVQYGISDVGFAAFSSYPITGGAAPISFGGVELWPGGLVFESDGSATAPFHEQGIHLKPEVPTLVEGAAASGSVTPATRFVIVRFKWIDSTGQTYRTAESTPVSITTVNANSSIQVTFDPSVAQTERDYIHVEVSITPAGGNGSEYFKVTPAVYMAQGTATSQTFTITASEATIAAGEPFVPFSATGPLPPVAPPAMNVIVEHRNRACGINAEDPRRIECSNEYSPGNSLTWTGVIVLIAPEPLYALASMDGHLIGFAKEAIYRWSGELPDARGEGPTLPLYDIIPSGVGTDQPRSVVRMELGVMFYSSLRGFHLLDRSLAVTYFGGAVETASANQTISGAKVHPTYPEVRFTSEGGTTFVFNTYWTKVAGTPIWTTFTGQACVHSITHNGKWYLLTSAGKLLEEDLARWQDGVALNGAAFTAGTAYTRALEVADINFAGVNGFARVREGTLLAEWTASEKITITTTPNHRRTDPTTGLPAADSAPYTYDATVNPDPYVVTWKPAVQKVTSLTVLIQDTTEFQTAGAEWQALSFLVGVKKGSYLQGVRKGMSGGARR